MTLNEWLWIPTQSESESSPWVVAMSRYLGHQSGLFVIMALHNESFLFLLEEQTLNSGVPGYLFLHI